MSRGSHNQVDIDRNKLKRELARRGTNLQQASFAIGRSRSYLGTGGAEGRIPKSAIMLLESKFGIKQEDIEAVEEITKADIPVSVPVPSNNGIDMDELKTVITEAIKEAFVWYANRRY